MTDVPRKKDGEKALLLHACGELLFGCPGETRVTQGIYIFLKSKKLECFCKRAVWIPSNSSLCNLRRVFDEFGAPMPPTINDDTVVGLCGKNPTRTARATDSTFILLTQTMKKKFIPAAIVSVDHSQIDEFSRPIITLRTVASDLEAINECIQWIKNEAKEYEREKATKHPREKRSYINNPNVLSSQPSSPDTSTVLSYDRVKMEDSDAPAPAKKRRRRRTVSSASVSVADPDVFSASRFGEPFSSYESSYPERPFAHYSHMIGMVPMPISNASQSQLIGVVPLPQMSGFCSPLEQESVSSPVHLATPVVSATVVASPEHYGLDSMMDMNPVYDFALPPASDSDAYSLFQHPEDHI